MATTVAEFGDCRWKRRLSPNYGDKLSPISATIVASADRLYAVYSAWADRTTLSGIALQLLQHADDCYSRATFKLSNSTEESMHCRGSYVWICVAASQIPWICIHHCILKTIIEMVLCGCTTSRAGCRVWHAELAFFVIVVFMASRALTADAKEQQQHSEGLKICFVNCHTCKSFTLSFTLKFTDDYLLQQSKIILLLSY